MTDTTLNKYLRELQKAQETYGDKLYGFSVDVKWDSFYGHYLECHYQSSDGRVSCSFQECYDDEEYLQRLKQLKEDLDYATGR